MAVELFDHVTGQVVEPATDAGGMRYRPAPPKPPLAQRIREHEAALAEEAAQNAKFCGATTKQGLPCAAYATATGLCAGHSRALEG